MSALTRDPDFSNAAGAGDPAHQLYAHAAALSASAHALEAAAHSAGAVAALAPTLACLETSLVALARATTRLRAQTLTRLAEPGAEAEELRRKRAEIALNLERLAGVLEQAEASSARVRAAIEPVATYM